MLCFFSINCVQSLLFVQWKSLDSLCSRCLGRLFTVPYFFVRSSRSGALQYGQPSWMSVKKLKGWGAIWREARKIEGPSIFSTSSQTALRPLSSFTTRPRWLRLTQSAWRSYGKIRYGCGPVFKFQKKNCNCHVLRVLRDDTKSGCVGDQSCLDSEKQNQENIFKRRNTPQLLK